MRTAADPPSGHARASDCQATIAGPPPPNASGDAPGALARSPRQRTEGEELRRLNRTLRALKSSSRAMLRATDEKAYLAEVCRIVVDDCGHAMVWIGFAEDDLGKTVRPVAHAGLDEGYLASLRVTWADTELGRGPTGTAIRTGRPAACADMQGDARFAPWRAEAVRRGFASSLVLPLVADGRAFGAITIYSREPASFSEEEQELLAELADDLAYGITFLRSRAAHRRAVEALRDSESRLRELADSLTEADRRKNDFLGVLSHELRNPLAPIQNCLHILDRTPPGGEQARRARQVIERQVAHLTRLVDDLLDVTRISRGKIQLRRGRLELGALLRRAVEDHRAMFTGREIALGLRLCAEPLWIDADSTRISQAIGNLLQNAAKFTNARGNVRVTLDRAGAAAAIRVADDGVGIAPQVLPQLFQPFRQADESLHRSLGGLGLGLALVKDLVEMHGGRVEVRSDGIGRGAEFSLALPLLPEAPPQTSNTPAPAPAAARRLVLVVEDNLDCAETLKEVLEMHGQQVEVAYDGRAGVAQARALRPEIVFCDIGLPGLDGYEVARQIRLDPAHSPTLVALSGYTRPDDQRKALEAGFDHHLGKPVELEQLEEILVRLASRKP